MSRRRFAKRHGGRSEGALDYHRPPHEIWSGCLHTSDAKLTSEFMALANRGEGVRVQVIAVEQSRRARRPLF